MSLRYFRMLFGATPTLFAHCSNRAPLRYLSGQQELLPILLAQARALFVTFFGSHQLVVFHSVSQSLLTLLTQFYVFLDCISLFSLPWYMFPWLVTRLTLKLIKCNFPTRTMQTLYIWYLMATANKVMQRKMSQCFKKISYLF